MVINPTDITTDSAVTQWGTVERVLVVDDSPTVQTAFCKLLSSKYECDAAGSFDEAVSKLRRGDYAVLITDIIMPGLSGIELLRKVVEEFPNMQVIVVSGIARSQRALDAMRLGAFDYLIKPIENDVLECSVERALERRQLLMSASRYKLDLESQNAELEYQKEQLKRLQAQIVHSEKMASLGQLAAGVAHELNNPVGFVHANLEILDEYIRGLTRLIKTYEQSELPATAGTDVALVKNDIGYPAILDDIDSIVADCREGSDRIRDIARNLRLFSRLDEAEFKETDIHEGIETTLRLLSRHFSSGNILLRREYGELPKINGFASQLNQVWMNLLANAAQAIGRREGEVTIATRSTSESVIVEIRDTGDGIAVQHLNRIFEPFFTTKPVGDGTGLGLSISFGIFQRHGGTISVISDLGSGTAFTVQLPRSFVPEAGPEEKSIALWN